MFYEKGFSLLFLIIYDKKVFVIFEERQHLHWNKYWPREICLQGECLRIKNIYPTILWWNSLALLTNIRLDYNQQLIKTLEMFKNKKITTLIELHARGSGLDWESHISLDSGIACKLGRASEHQWWIKTICRIGNQNCSTLMKVWSSERGLWGESLRKKKISPNIFMRKFLSHLSFSLICN